MAQHRIKLQYSLAALQAEREKLVRIQQREYQRLGNTQRCQEIWKQIEAIDKQIENRMKEV